jgi:hypothetical protein
MLLIYYALGRSERLRRLEASEVDPEFPHNISKAHHLCFLVVAQGNENRVAWTDFVRKLRTKPVIKLVGASLYQRTALIS